MPPGNQVGTISIKVTPDTSHFREELRAKLEAIEKGLEARVPVKADFDANGIREKVRAATAGLDKTIKVGIDDKADFRLRQRLAKLNPKVKVDVDVDNASLSRLRSKLTGPGGGGGGALQLFGGAGSNLAFIAAIASVAAPAIALVTGALAALPAAIAGVATPIGVIALGLDGLKKAAEVLKAPLDGLKKDISGVFEQRLAAPFAFLAQQMPKLSGPLSSVAHGISDVASSLINAVATGPGMANLQGTIRNIAGFVSTMAPGVGSLANGLLGLANNVSAKFPSVSMWINQAAGAFDTWVQKVSGDGSLDRAMANMGTVFQGISNIVGDIAKQGFAWLQDPQFAASMNTFVTATQSLVNSALPELGNVFGQISDGVSGSSTAVDKINSMKLPDWLPDFLKNDHPTPPEQIDPSKGWGKGLKKGSILEGVFDRGWKGAIDPNNLFGPGWFSEVRKELSFGEDPGDEPPKGIWNPAWATSIRQKLKDAFNLSDNPLGKGTGDDFWGSIGMASAAAETGTQAGQTLAQNLATGFNVGQAAVGGIQTQIQQIGPQIQAALAGATAQLQTIPAQIQQAFSGVGAAVTGSMATVVGAVANAGSQIVASFTGSLSQIPGIATSVFGQVQAAAAAGMANVVSAITSGAATAVAAVQSMGQQIVAALQSAAAGARAAGAAVGQGMAAGISAGKAAAVAAAQDLAAAVTAASQVKLGIKSPSTVFHDIGVNTMKGLENGITEEGASVISAAQALSQKLAEAMDSGVVDSSMADDVKRSLKELDLVSKGLKLGVDETTDKDKKKSLRDQIAGIQTLKDQLGLQKEQLGFSEKYGDQTADNTDQNKLLTDSVDRLVGIGKGFATANADQFMSDLGISGEGAIPVLAGQGVDFMTKFLSTLLSGGLQTQIHVNSVDEALAAKQNLQNKQAHQFAGR